MYSPGAGPAERWHRGVPFDLHLMVFGDSTATGYGARIAEEVPGVLIARSLAEASGKRIRLSPTPSVGATSLGGAAQSAPLVAGAPPPDAAVIMIGANDITRLHGIGPSARRLGAAVRRLRASGAVVVVGTCPDFGVITAIPQPLRTVTRSRGLRLARAQASAVRSSGGVPVPLADLLSPDFRKAPELFFSEDMFHPSGAGYALAAKQLLPALCNALGDLTATVEPESPLETRAADANTLLSRLGVVSRLWRRSTGVPAPIVA